jgi:hypothetical protein
VGGATCKEEEGRKRGDKIVYKQLSLDYAIGDVVKLF